MALRTAAVYKRGISMPETQVFSPPNLSDAAEMRAARSWMRSRRRMLDTRDTSITFLPLSDGEQLTLRNQLDARLKQAPKPELGNRIKPEPPKVQGKTEADQVFGRSRIAKIFKLWQVKDNDKSKEVREETKLRPGRKLAAGTYEITLNTNLDEQEPSKDARLFRLHIPKACPTKAKVMVVIARDPSQFQNPSVYEKEAPTEESASESKEKFIIVTALAGKQSHAAKSQASAQARDSAGRFVSDHLVKKHEQKEGRFPANNNDRNYVAEIVKLTAELTNATNDPLGWSWTSD